MAIHRLTVFPNSPNMQHVLHVIFCFTWFSKVCLRVLPGVGSSSILCAFCITSITSSLAFLIAFWISTYVCGSAMVSPIPIEWPKKQFSQLYDDDSRVSQVARIIRLNEKIQSLLHKTCQKTYSLLIIFPINLSIH